MRVGFEGKVLTAHAGGTGRYAINLLRALLTTARPTGLSNLELIIFTGPQTTPGILKNLDGSYLERFLPVKSSLMRSLVLLPAALRRERIDLFHGLDHMAIPLRGKQGKYVASLHDVIPLKFPHLFTAKHRLMVRTALARMAQQADLVITPSQASLEDLLTLTSIDKDRVAVVPAAGDPKFTLAYDPARLDQVRTRYGLPARYILALGTLEPRKNLPALLHAFAELRQQHDVDPDLRLVLAGPKGWKDSEIFHTFQRLGLANTVIFPGFIAEPDLPDVYRGATCMAFPSLYEGFGFPILESMQCGIPVMASNNSSIPEVAGDAALLVDPTHRTAMVEALHTLVTRAEVRAALRHKGLVQARLFNWDTTAQKTLALYTSLGI